MYFLVRYSFLLILKKGILYTLAFIFIKDKLKFKFIVKTYNAKVKSQLYIFSLIY
jgi:hypothetical protein